MGNIMDVEMKVNPEYLEKSAEKIVKAGIIEALGDPSKILTKAVDSVLSMKVDRDGKVSTSYSAVPYIEWLATKTIQDTVKDCIKEVIDERKPEFEAAIKKNLASKTFINTTASCFLKAILDAANSRWNMPINVDFRLPED